VSSSHLVGNIPEWATGFAANRRFVSLGNLVRLRNEKNDPIRISQVLSLTAARGVIRYEEKGAIGNNASEDISRYSIVREGDIVVNSMNVIIGSVGLSKYDGVLSPVYYVLTPLENGLIDMRFLAYHFQIQSFQKSLIKIGNGILDHRMKIPWINLKAEKIALPPIEEQRRIADYLDEQVGRIDKVIELKNKVLALGESAFMEQLRHLTTLPRELGSRKSEGWVTKKVSWLFRTGSGTTPASDVGEYFEGNIPWVNSGDLNDSLMSESRTSISEAAFAAYSALKIYPAGSLLVAMYGATVGKTGMLGISACVNQAVCVLESTAELSCEYAHFWFIANRQNLIDQSIGGGQPNINQEIIRKQKISFPSSTAQSKIITEIQQLSTKRLERSDTVMKSIDTLIEYRTSLITSAVTGQFDVTTGRSVA
jgi:type I restriction enzyme S subunit